VKEVARHLLRRPVVGVAVAGRAEDGRWLLIKRRDTRRWALPGGTLEWGETLRAAAERELLEETGARILAFGVYSKPERDPRFHAVTVVVHARVELMPGASNVNPAEVVEVRLFDDAELPGELSHTMTDMLANARSGEQAWE
jgi:8-oxo-dGTP diphosphatase